MEISEVGDVLIFALGDDNVGKTYKKVVHLTSLDSAALICSLIRASNKNRCAPSFTSIFILSSWLLGGPRPSCPLANFTIIENNSKERMIFL